ncbi:MAG: outer membrane protein [Alphaproteobacteria bacterium]
MSRRMRMLATFAAILAMAAGTMSCRSARQAGTWHQGPYVTGFAGGAFGGQTEFDDTFDVDQKAGFLGGGTIGYDDLFLTDSGDFRFEAEASYRSQDLKGPPGEEVSITTLTGNLWYDFAVRGRLVPYLGAGMGVGFLEEADDQSGFVFQLGGGVNYHLNRSWFLGFNYRYLVADFDLEDISLDKEIDYSGHQLSAAIGYKF